MYKTTKVETRGISDNWLTANGDFTTKSRGVMNMPQLFIALQHLSSLDAPDANAPCSPHIQTKGEGGLFSFTGQGGTIFCPETDQAMTPQQAAYLALGKATLAPSQSAMPAQSENASASMAGQVTEKQKLSSLGGVIMFLAIGFLVVAAVKLFGVISVYTQGVNGDNIMSAATTGGGLGVIGILMFILALKLRKPYYVDEHGTRVNANGSALPFVKKSLKSGSSRASALDNFDGFNDVYSDDSD